MLKKQMNLEKQSENYSSDLKYFTHTKLIQNNEQKYLICFSLLEALGEHRNNDMLECL